MTRTVVNDSFSLTWHYDGGAAYSPFVLVSKGIDLALAGTSRHKQGEDFLGTVSSPAITAQNKSDVTNSRTG